MILPLVLTFALAAQAPLVPPALRKTEPIGPRIEASRQRILAGDARGAIVELESLLQADPRAPEVFYWLGIAYLDLGRVEEAREALAEALELASGAHADALYHLGLIELQTGRPEAAVPLLEKAIAQSSSPFEAAENALAAAHFSNRSFDLAIALLDRVTSARPRDANAQHMLGLALEQRFLRGGAPSDLGLAIKAQQRAVDARPDYAIAHRDLGLTLLWFGRATQAASHLERFALLQPSHPSAPTFKELAGRLRAGLSQEPGESTVTAAPAVRSGPGAGASFYSPEAPGSMRRSGDAVVDGIVLADGTFFSLGAVTAGAASEALETALASSALTPGRRSGRPLALRVLVAR